MRSLAPSLRTLAALALLVPGAAGAVTLEQYFFGFSDRDRGVYITGVLDLFAADSSRDPEYRHCVGELGAAGMHEAISKIVKEDPRLLSFDASLWILYEASRHCNTSAGGTAIPDPRSMLPPAAEPAPGLAGVPDLASAPGEETASDALASETPWPLLRDWRHIAGGLLLLLLAGGLAGLLARRLRRRAGRRHDDAARPRRPTPSSEHG